MYFKSLNCYSSYNKHDRIGLKMSDQNWAIFIYNYEICFALDI